MHSSTAQTDWRLDRVNGVAILCKARRWSMYVFMIPGLLCVNPALCATVAEINAVKVAVVDSCSQPTTAGSYLSASTDPSKDQIHVTVRGGQVTHDLLFTKEEWTGVQRVLQSQQEEDNKGYRSCVQTLTDLFLKKIHGGVDVETISREVTDAYKYVGWKLWWFNDWGRPPQFWTLRVSEKSLFGNAQDGRVVSTSIDPQLFPVPRYYNASLSDIATLGPAAASAVNDFFSSYEQLRQALTVLSNGQVDVRTGFIEAQQFARETIKRGRLAFCAMGLTPPAMFPDGGLPEYADRTCP